MCSNQGQRASTTSKECPSPLGYSELCTTRRGGLQDWNHYDTASTNWIEALVRVERSQWSSDRGSELGKDGRRGRGSEWVSE